jgi:WD40 repeat protein/tetratricopeptide (TPR) repeat protein
MTLSLKLIATALILFSTQQPYARPLRDQDPKLDQKRVGQTGEDHTRVAALQAASEAEALVATKETKLWPQALEKINHALDLVKQLRDKPLEMKLNIQFGELAVVLSKYAEAKNFFRQALDLSEALGDDLSTANLLARLGNVHAPMDPERVQNGLTYYNRALAILTVHPDNGLEAEVLTRRSECYESLGMFRRQAMDLERAATLFHATDRPREQAETLVKLARLYREYYAAKGREGLQALKYASDVYRKLGDSTKTQQILLELNDYQKQVVRLEALEQWTQKLNKLVLENQRELEQSAKDKLKQSIDDAEADFLRGDVRLPSRDAFFPGTARESAIRVLADFYFAAGLAHEALGNIKKAREYFGAAVEIYEDVDYTPIAEQASKKSPTAEAVPLEREDNKDAENHRPRLAIQSKPDVTVGSLAFHPEGRILASVTVQGTIKLWDTRTGQVLDTLPSHVGKEPDIEFGPKGNTLIVSSSDASELWNAARGELIRVVSGQTTFNASEEIVASFSSLDFKSDVVNLWDARSGKFLDWLTGHEGPILSVTFSPDGKLLASGGVDRTVRIWDAQRRNLLHTLEGHNGAVVAIYFNQQGNEVRSYGSGGDYICWDVQTGRLLKRESRKDRSPDSDSYSSNNRDLSLSPDRRVKAKSLGTSIELRNASNGQLIKTLTGNPILPSLVQFSEDGKSLVVVNDSYLTRLDLHSGVFIKTHKLSGGIIGQIEEMSFGGGDALNFHIVNPDGRTEILKSAGGYLEFRDIPSGELINVVDWAFKGRFSRDGKRVILDTELRNARTGTLVRTFPDTISLGFSRDSRIVIGLNDETRKPRIFIADAKTGKTVMGQKLRALNNDKTSLPPHIVTDINISNDLRRLAITESGVSGSNGSGILYDTQNGEELGFISGGNGVFPTTFSPDSKLIAVQNNETEIDLIDAEDGSLIDTLTGHSNYVESLDFSPDSKLLVSSSLDGTIKLWDVEDCKLLATLLLFEDSNWLAVAPDGLFDGTADAMEAVNWRVGPSEAAPLAWFFNDFYYPGLIAEIAESRKPKAKIDIATVLQLPGLRTMLAQGQARIEKRAGKTVLCFDDKPTALPEVYSDAQLTAFDSNDLIFDEDVGLWCSQKELPADVQYELVNATSDKRSDVFKPIYDGASSETARSTLHILTVAVGDYDVSTSGFKKLNGSVSGAQAVANFFVAQKRSAKHPYRDIKIWPGLYNRKATLENIRQRLRELARAVKKEDVVFLFFAGHGIVPAGQEMFYFAPVDMRGPNPKDQHETGLSTAMLTEAIRALPANRVVLLIDACQSGGAVESLAKIAEVKAKLEERQARIEKREWSKQRNHRVGVYIIAAATPLQQANEPRIGNSALVSTLLEILKSRPSASGEVRIKDLVRQIEKDLPEVSAKAGVRQTPMIVSTGVDFAIARSKSSDRAPRARQKIETQK